MSFQTVRRAGPVALAALALTGGAFALAPLVLGGGGPGLEIVFVTDPVLDRVYRCSELVVNGAYNDDGDVVVLYDDVVGSIALTDPIAITTFLDDTVYVGDSSERIVLALNDVDEDGDASEAGEHWLYFDGHAGGNFHGHEAPHISAVATSLAQSVVWLASSSTQSGEGEVILRLEDMNLDLDANDFGEAAVFYTAPESHHDDSRIVGLRMGDDGRLYFAENGSSGARARGVYRLEDANNNGVIDAGEESAFWLPSLPVGAELSALDHDEAEYWYLLDRTNSVVYRGRDDNDDGVIDASEYGPVWSVSSPLVCNDIAVTDEGGLHIGDSGGTTRMFFGADLDASGVVDVTEEIESYSSALSNLDMGAAHGVAADFHAHGEIGTAFCFGVTPAVCPCSNFGAVGTGCANSTGAGALLEGEGSTGIANDDAAFHAHGMPANANAVLFQGTLAVNGGIGAPFRDGLRCVAGAVRRLGLNQADAAGGCEWGPGLAATGGWAAGQTLNFQVWYRDPQGPCSNGSNFTNALAVTFDP